MTPKEKAEELVDKFNLPSGLMSIERKQCALIAVDEIYNSGLLVFVDDEQYWHEVKQEIEKI
jgi:hypothetical protein